LLVKVFLAYLAVRAVLEELIALTAVCFDFEGLAVFVLGKGFHVDECGVVGYRRRFLVLLVGCLKWRCLGVCVQAEQGGNVGWLLCH
jgi:hypothetical protein